MGRGWAAIAVLLLTLAACKGGGANQPYVESRTPADLGPRFYPPENWGWGLVQVGDAPAQRYGVSAPATAVRAQILILPDYGETAETWFETAADLNAMGYDVWVLEGAGQGGSGRLTEPRDLGYLTSFNPDLAAVRAMVATVIRPTATAPLIVLGQGVGGMVAARSLERGLPAAALILSSPALDDRPGGAATDLTLLIAGKRRAAGPGAWSRAGPDAFALGGTHDPWRGRATHLWQTSNPDLRMGGPSGAWITAFDASAAEARKGLKDITVPTLLLEGDAPRGCRDLPACQAQALPGGAPMLELERDPIRRPWLTAIDTFIRAQIAPPQSSASPRH
jgi:lysophospholipase